MNRHIPSVGMKDAPHGDRSREHDPYHIDAPVSAWLSASRKQPASPALFRIDARAIGDANAGITEQGSIVLERDRERMRVRYSGPTFELPAELTHESIPLLTLHDQLVLPALVNAHAHLDLSHIGPRPHDPGDGFVSWVDMIRTNRASEDEAIERCVRLGIERSLAGGVIAVGDIAGAPGGRLTHAPAHALAESPLRGVSYLEFFGIGATAASTIKRIRAECDTLKDHALDWYRDRGIELGWQPHAPNTVDLGVYRWVTSAALSLGMPLSTHLAETPEEREFVERGSGPQRALLERLGVWDDSVIQQLGKGNHPIEHLRPVLESGRYLVAHVNDADDRGIQILAETGTCVAFCPRASAYFGAANHFGAHRYRDMLDAGVNVCLGTDSIVNLETRDRISTLDDMRLLYREGDHDTIRLLAMGTTRGAAALGLPNGHYSIQAGSCPVGLIGIRVEPVETGSSSWSDAMNSNEAPTWLYLE